MNILITHGYSDSNKGDLAITLATYKFLNSRYPEAKIILHSTFRKDSKDFAYHNRFMSKENLEIKQGILPSPYTTSSKSISNDLLAVTRLVVETLQLKLSLLSNTLGKLLGGKQFKSLQDYIEADLVVVKGGQFIYNDKEDLRGNLFLWRTLQPLKLAHLFKKKIIIFGQSFGGFASEKSQKTAVKYLNYCDLILAREEVSLAFLKKYDLEKKSRLIPDLAFYLKNDYKENDDKTTHIPGKIFGVTVVNWTFPESLDPIKAKENYINTLYRSITYTYQKHGLIPVFIPQVTVKHHGKSDNDIVKIIQNRLDADHIPNHFIEEDLSVQEMMRLYKECEFLIGTRLHSCILAANVETPIIAIRYQGYKTQGVMKELGLEEMILDIHTLKEEELNQKIELTINNYSHIKDKIKTKTNNFTDLFQNLHLE